MAAVFDMSFQYTALLEEVTKKAVNTLMLDTANQLYSKRPKVFEQLEYYSRHNVLLTSALRLLGRFAAEHNHTPTASRLVCGLYTS